MELAITILLGGLGAGLFTLLRRDPKQWAAWKSWATATGWKRIAVGLPLIAATLGALSAALIWWIGNIALKDIDGFVASIIGGAAGAAIGAGLGRYLSSIPDEAKAIDWLRKGLADHVRAEVKAWVRSIPSSTLLYLFIVDYSAEAKEVLGDFDTWTEVLESIEQFRDLIDDRIHEPSERASALGDGRSVLVDFIVKLPITRPEADATLNQLAANPP